jgi:hypothetical protein
MDKVKALIAAGATLSEAVRSALGDRSLAQVALERQVDRSNLISALNGGRAPTRGDIDAMIAELGGTPDEWRPLFADAMQKRVQATA